MNLTQLSLKRPVTVAMFFVCMTVIGMIAGQRLPLEFLPDIEFPGLFVEVPYRNSTPEEVERRITRPIEEALATLPGIERMHSESTDSGANVFLQFDWGQDLAIKGVEARDKIDSVRNSLPQELERIQVHKFEAGSIPVLTLRVSAERDLSNAYDMLERNLKRRLERLPGISKVELYGVEPKEVRIELAADRVAAHGIDLRELGKTLQKANFALTAGDYVEAGKRYYVKPEGRFESLDAIRAVVIDRRGLRLGDIADVEYTDPVRTYGRHLDGHYAIGLNIFKETGANMVEVADRAMAELDAVRALPEMAGISLYVMDNTADAVRKSLDDLVQAGLIGALLSIIVLYAFLRDWKMTAIVTSAVPLSLMITLAAMYFLGFSLNILTLMGLMLSVGMLVDNSVVVTESIFSERSRNADPVSATLNGVRGVALAVALGTLTTAIVFLPNVFGVQNEITIYLSHVAVTICVSLAASLLIALTLIPQLTTRFRSESNNSGGRWIERLAHAYARVLGWTLRHPAWTGLFIVLTLASVAVPAALVKQDMFPEDSGKRLFLRYNVNSVYSLSKVEEAVNTVEAYLFKNKERFEIESVYTYFDLGRAESSIILKDPDQLSQKPKQIRDEIRKGLPKIAIGDPSFEENRQGSGEKLSVQIFGESSEYLRDVAREAERVMRQIPGLTDVRLNTTAEDWEVRVRVDRDKARLYELSSQDVAEVVAGAMRGVQLRPYRTPTGEVEMVLQFRREDRLNLDALRALPVVTPKGERVTLSTLAELSIGDVPGKIERDDRHTALTIDFGTAEGTTAEDARKHVRETLDQMQFPPGYSWGYGRAFDDDQESMQTMVQNMLLAIACIYIVMAALFESVLAPTAIISSILFSFIGVFWFFLATGTDFSFMAMIGMLVLMGVVVNNGIVLIDHINQLRERGIDRREAVLHGSRDRLRPILMTAATTVLGMVPLALNDTTLGGNGPAYFPMARAIIGGLVFATFISLLVLPTIYLALEDMGHWGRRTLHRARHWWPRPPGAAAARTRMTSTPHASTGDL
ncbi:efflux RND transporter permease subunit [Sinimarinibacterium sp. CAU 1509]|uniref:efflux RND transporter permease subunit n=1 Tax=Sinimarinibacterium sp. CAU 1509 TaxID=2562283 RepID=UPI0010AB590A|nr:efflux RND transporter permease subunit [Sinimarinibacterium sp. CAU 1509]TJY60016.1 efflux RND transporter permease subunit [Sinimarinibacterium sp. CAU 1509]